MGYRDPAQITCTRAAGDQHVVASLEGGGKGYRRQPCEGCPWRVDRVGEFPPEAFVHSAETAYDQADRQFACHTHGVERPLTCAGFLLRGAVHNLVTRMHSITGAVDLSQVHDGGHALHPTYRAMAVANGVDLDHPRLAPCRDDQ